MVLGVAFAIYARSIKLWINEIHQAIICNHRNLIYSASFAVRCAANRLGICEFLFMKVSGIMTINKDDVIFWGYKPNSDKNVRQVSLAFQPGAAEVTWIGRYFTLSPSHWFSVRNGSQIYYFTIENGGLFPSNEAETRKCYTDLKNALESV